MNYKLIAVTLFKRRIFKFLMIDDSGKLQHDYKRDPNFLPHYALARYARETAHMETSLDLSNHKNDYLLMTNLNIEGNKIELTMIIVPFQIKPHIERMIEADPSVRMVCFVKTDGLTCGISVVSSDAPVPELSGKPFSECINEMDDVFDVSVNDIQQMKTLYDVVCWTHNPKMLDEIETRAKNIAKAVNSQQT